MPKTILTCVLTLMFGMTGLAHAHKLDPKWSTAREETNHLGDLAKGGDAQALAQLTAKAAGDDATARHNMGWLYDNGFEGAPANKDKACEWYGQGAALKYPPSMHGFGLCQFKKSRAPGAGDEFETRAIKLMFDAAAAGWTKASIYLSEYFLNLPLLAEEDADTTQGIIAFGLDSNPTHEEKVALSYLLGMAMIYGTRATSPLYRAGRDALLFAEENNHPAATEALPLLYTKWMNAHMRRIAAWSPPTRSGLDCYKAEQASSTDKRFTALICRIFNEGAQDELDRLTQDSDSLLSEVSNQQRGALELALENLDERSAQFRADKQELSDIIQNLPE